MITVEFVFSLQIDENYEIQENKRDFSSVFVSGSVKTIFRVKKSFGVILAIFGLFS